MGALTEKQFKKALGHINLASDRWAKFVEKHPVEQTDEWLYEFDKFRAGDFHCGTGGYADGSRHGGLDLESEGYYGVAMYDQ